MPEPVASTSTSRLSTSSSSAPRRFPVGWDVPTTSALQQRRRSEEGPSSDVELSENFVQATGIRKQRKEGRKPERKRRREDAKGKGPATEADLLRGDPCGRLAEERECPSVVVIDDPVAFATPILAPPPAPRPRRSVPLVPPSTASRPLRTTSSHPPSVIGARLAQVAEVASPSDALGEPWPRRTPTVAPPVASAPPAAAVRPSELFPRPPTSSRTTRLNAAEPVQRAPEVPARRAEAYACPGRASARPGPPPSTSSAPTSTIPSGPAPSPAPVAYGYSPANIRTLYAPRRAFTPVPPQQTSPAARLRPTREAAVPLERHKPKRGPVVDDILFGGPDKVPRAEQLPVAPVHAPTPMRRLLQIRATSKPTSPEEAQRRRLLADAEERRRRTAWEEPISEQAPAVNELPTKDEPAQAAIDALFSPLESPTTCAPRSSREASPELFAGVDVSQKKKASSALLSRERESETRSRSPSARQPQALDASDGDRGEIRWSAGSRVKEKEPTGSPEFEVGLFTKGEVRGRKTAGQKQRRAPAVQAKQTKGVKSALPVAEKKAKSSSQKKWVVEDSWWTRCLDPERGSAQVPRQWAAPEQPGLQQVLETTSERTLEVVIREVVLSSSDIFQAILDKGEWWVYMRVALYTTATTGTTLLCQHELRVRLLLKPPDPHAPTHRSFRLDYPRPFPLAVDLAALSKKALALEVTLTDTSVSFLVRHTFSSIAPFCGHLHFLSSASVATATPCQLSADALKAQEPGISLLCATRSIPSPTLPTQQRIVTDLAARLERIALDREAPSGVWIPDAVAVRGEEVARERALPLLELDSERSGFDFLTKVPIAPGESVRLFVEDTVETTGAAVRGKDDEISRSSMSLEEKLLARMQMRWCLLNPYPPTVYHRERACWVHYAPVLAHFALRDTLVLHLVRHLVQHQLVTPPQLREVVRALDAEVARVEHGEREGYDDWRRRTAWEAQRA